MESVRARKSCSPYLPTNWLDATNLVPGSSALASLHTDVYTPRRSAFQPDRKAGVAADWRMPTGVVSSSSPFTFLFHRLSLSLSYPLLYSAAIRQERFTRPDIRLHTFETCVNGGREATATGVRFSLAHQQNSWKFYSCSPPGEEIRGSFEKTEGRGRSSRHRVRVSV